MVVGPDRRAELVLTYDTFDLGFQIYLHDFKRKLDSGSRMESHFSSLVDVLDRGAPPKRLQENVLITMNEPLSATDPKSACFNPVRPWVPHTIKSTPNSCAQRIVSRNGAPRRTSSWSA